MNGDDLLERATRALRDATDEDDDANVAATTLARIERSTRSARTTTLRRSSLTRWVVVPMAASFIVFAAWASASGHLTQWMSAGKHDEVERTEPALPASTIARPAVGSPAPPVAPEPRPEPEPAPAPAPEPTASAPVKKILAPATSVDVDGLYREAHAAHFVRRDPAAALAGWDRYLAAAGPSGRFAPEVRYNRAICLVRLGRRAEAAAALRPFASGEYGGYRRDEAAQLLRSLE
jgi:hypothetical protein